MHSEAGVEAGSKVKCGRCEGCVVWQAVRQVARWAGDRHFTSDQAINWMAGRLAGVRVCGCAGTSSHTPHAEQVTAAQVLMPC